MIFAKWRKRSKRSEANKSWSIRDSIRDSAIFVYIYIYIVAFTEVNMYSGHKSSDSMNAQDRTHDAVQRSHF